MTLTPNPGWGTGAPARARYGLSGLVAEGLEEHSLMRGRTFDEMVRWRNGKLIDVLRVLDHDFALSSE